MSTRTSTFGATMHHEWFTDAPTDSIKWLVTRLHTITGVKRARWDKHDDIVISVELDTEYQLNTVVANVQQAVGAWAEQYGVTRRPQRS